MHRAVRVARAVMRSTPPVMARCAGAGAGRAPWVVTAPGLVPGGAPRGGCRVRWSSSATAANDVREGDLLEMDGGLWRVVKREFSRTAMGRAYVQMELRHMTEGTKRDMRYRSEDMLDKAALDSPGRYTVLYFNPTVITCMHTTNYDQVEIPTAMVGEQARYLADGMTLSVESYKGNPAVVSLPPRVPAKVVAMDETGGTATVDCAAAAEGGGNGGGATFKVRVPKFVKVGDTVTLDTSDGKYIGRA